MGARRSRNERIAAWLAHVRDRECGADPWWLDSLDLEAMDLMAQAYEWLQQRHEPLLSQETRDLQFDADHYREEMELGGQKYERERYE